jgi:hypothetical protein
MLFPDWLKRTFGVRHVPGTLVRRGRRTPATRRLCLEPLKDRLAPAAVTAANSLTFGEGTAIPISGGYRFLVARGNKLAGKVSPFQALSPSAWPLDFRTEKQIFSLYCRPHAEKD